MGTEPMCTTGGCGYFSDDGKWKREGVYSLYKIFLFSFFLFSRVGRPYEYASGLIFVVLLSKLM